MRNQILSIRKIESESIAIDKKKSILLKKQSILSLNEMESYPENEMFFLQKNSNLILSRIKILNIQNPFKRTPMRISKSLVQKSLDNSKENCKIFDLISVFSDKIIEHLSRKFKNAKIVLCLDVKTSIQVIFSFDFFH